ncbi:hypothetical protein GDO81_018470 [Engystomops pustulosus]|uniref:Uncharacterized protein n=1 Tax=Engystomops pustulosus TaxID=76066 RepID=A0AAV6ZPJ9_ENGPU|nr:hypothetical protein GDO81_018470 [Engystomops pustulosus]
MPPVASSCQSLLCQRKVKVRSGVCCTPCEPQMLLCDPNTEAQVTVRRSYWTHPSSATSPASSLYMLGCHWVRH